MPQTIADLIAAWVPVIIVIGVFIYFARASECAPAVHRAAA
jgi:hypothetical protein